MRPPMLAGPIDRQVKFLQDRIVGLVDRRRGGGAGWLEALRLHAANAERAQPCRDQARAETDQPAVGRLLTQLLLGLVRTDRA